MNRLKELRQEKKLTQKELADKIGVHYRTLQNWENNKAEIKPDKAKKLAKILNVRVGYLLGYIESAEPKPISNSKLVNIGRIKNRFNVDTKELANLVDVSEDTFKSWENKESFMPFEKAKLLSDVFDVPTIYFTDQKTINKALPNLNKKYSEQPLANDKLETSAKEAFESANSFLETQLKGIKEIISLLNIGNKNNTLTSETISEALKLIEENIEDIDETVSKMIEFQVKYTAEQIYKHKLQNSLNKPAD